MSLDYSSITSLPTYETPKSGGLQRKEKGNEADAMRMDFLTLLTKQLEYQDPMAPMENAEFTQQLAQFSGLEEQQKTNALLNAMMETQKGLQVNQALDYLNRQVVVQGSKVGIKDGQGAVHFKLDEAAAVHITLFDANGAAVSESDVHVGAGEQAVDIDGSDLPDGVYSVRLEAKGIEGTQVTATPFESGTVTSVINGPDGIQLEVNGRQVGLSKVLRIE